MLCAVPALRALRASFPVAHITLIGLPWVRELAALLPRFIDAVDEFPGFPGIPERPFDARRTCAFIARAQEQQFDLVIQLHGSGSHINEFAMLLGAHRTAAFYRDGDTVPENGVGVPWPTTGTESERLLALPLALGCADTGLTLQLDVTSAHRIEAGRAVLQRGRTFERRSYACIHPGARFLSRRWMPERFAAVGDALAARGLAIAITGTASEAPVTGQVRDQMRCDAVDLTGALSLGALAALVHDSALVVCNDTGMSHVAAAVGTPSVVIASGSDVARWAPHNSKRHRVLWHHVPCRPCMHVDCPTGHECAVGVDVEQVRAAAKHILEREAIYA